MKKAIAIILTIAMLAPLSAQPVQYFMQRSSLNTASISEVRNLQIFLSGAHSLTGFEGAPKNILLNIAAPAAQKQRSGYYQRPQKSKYGQAQHVRNFVGGTLSSETFGVHLNLNAMLDYGYRLWINESANITFGLSAGINQTSHNYDKIKNESSSVQSQKETEFAFQFGTRIEVNKFNVSAFGNNKNLFGEIVFGRLWDYEKTSQNSYYDDEKQKAWNGQLSVLFSFNNDTKTSLFRFSANAVYRGGFGVGICYQTNKDLSANVSLRFTKTLQIGYAYGLTKLNPVAPKHEIALRYKIVRDEDE